MVQVSRFDPWKDPIGVIEAYRIVREEFPTVQLVLAEDNALLRDGLTRILEAHDLTIRHSVANAPELEVALTDPEVDVFDRESVFLDRVLAPLRRRFPDLRIALEHVTTLDGVDFVRDPGQGAVAAARQAAQTVHELLREYFARQLPDVLIHEFSSKFRRPLNSRLDCAKVSAQFGLQLPDWEQAARGVIAP